MCFKSFSVASEVLYSKGSSDYKKILPKWTNTGYVVQRDLMSRVGISNQHISFNFRIVDDMLKQPLTYQEPAIGITSHFKRVFSTHLCYFIYSHLYEDINLMSFRHSYVDINVDLNSTYWVRMTHLCVNEWDRHWFRQWPVTGSAPSQYWLIVDWTTNFIQENYQKIPSVRFSTWLSLMYHISMV